MRNTSSTSLKEIINTFKRTNTSKTIKNNRILTDYQNICKEWEEYIRDLFDDICLMTLTGICSNASDPSILESEMVYAFSILKNRKVPGENNSNISNIQLATYAEIRKLVRTKKFCQCYSMRFMTAMFLWID